MSFIKGELPTLGTSYPKGFNGSRMLPKPESYALDYLASNPSQFVDDSIEKIELDGFECRSFCIVSKENQPNIEQLAQENGNNEAKTPQS